MRTLYTQATLYARNERMFSVRDGRFEDFYFEHPGGPFDREIDLQGQTVLPGFNDAHGHFLGLMYIKRQINVEHITSLDDLKTAFQDVPTLIQASKYNEHNFPDHTLLDRTTLDALRADIPVLVLRVCGHVLMANSKAIEVALNKNPSLVQSTTHDLARGRFYETGIRDILAAFLDPSKDAIKADLLAAEKLCFKAGITSFQSDDFVVYPVPYERVIAAYDDLKDRLKIRIYQQAHLNTLNLYRDFIAKGYPKKWVGRMRMGPLKLLVDGSLGGQTAAMHAPYQGSDANGLLNFNEATLVDYFNLAQHAQMDVSWHAIGDRATATILDALKKSHRQKDARHAIIHAQLTGHEEIKTMRALQMGAMIQPCFLDDDIPILDAYLGKKAADTYLFNTLYQSVPTALSTDAPISALSPLKNIYHAVTRKSLKHPDWPAHRADEGLSIADAIDGYTTMGAYFMHQETTLGALKKGYLADFTVIDRLDLSDIESFLTARVTVTAVQGEHVYDTPID